MSTPFGNAGNMMNPNLPPNFNPSSSSSQAQGPNQPYPFGVGFQGQYQLAQAQAQAHAQAQAQAQALAQAQAIAKSKLAAQLLQAQGMTLNQAQAMGIGNFGSTSSPSIPGTKRVHQKSPLGPGQLMERTSTASAHKNHQKPQEKQSSEKIARIFPESALYTQLLEFESRVDSILMKQKFNLQEALLNPPSAQKTLRIYVFNTFANQNPDEESEPPSWTLKIMGQILEDGTGTDPSTYPKFSSFFKKVSIELDQGLYPEDHLILWEKSRSSAFTDGFEVKRKGDKEFTVKIQFEINYMPEKYKLSPPMAQLLGTAAETRPKIIAGIWNYVKARKLQNLNDLSLFYCDPPLQRIFGETQMNFTMIPQKITQHMFPPSPIQVEHQIKLSGDSPAGNSCYDVLVDIPLPIQRDLAMQLAHVENTKEIEAHGEAICKTIKRIDKHRKMRANLLGFSQSPVEFVNALIEKQAKDLKLGAGETSRNAEERLPDFNQPWVEDAVIRYLTRKQANAPNVPGNSKNRS